MNEVLVLLPEAGEEEVERWLSAVRRALADSGGGTCAVGAALYPCGSFPKSALPANARKALLHTRFFGPDTLTFFDSASLNISGDIYYEEGDLAAAIKEYRQGLQLNGQNVNLLNSLAVAYAQMNRYRQAIPLFEQALAADPENFMALFNLGYAHLAEGRATAAHSYFERGLALQPEQTDLLLQLGRLDNEAGRYETAFRYLSQAAGEGDSKEGGAVSFHLGEACWGLGRNREAMAHLERAIRFNPRDARAISLLGELYALENEGDEVALSLCRQALEIDEGPWQYWSRMAKVREKRGEVPEAIEALKASLRRFRRNPDALARLERLYAATGRQAAARRVGQRRQKLAVAAPAPAGPAAGRT